MSANDLFFISRLIILLTLMLGIRAYKHTTVFYKLLLGHVALAFVTETIGAYYLDRKENNAFIYNLFLLVDIPLVIVAASKIIKSKATNRYTIISIILYCALWFVTVYKYTMDKPIYLAFTLGSIILCIFFLAIAIQQYAYQQNISIHSPIVWVCIAILIYYASNIPTFSSLGYLLKNKPNVASSIFRINLLLSITHYISIGIAFILCKPRSTINKLLS